MDGPNTLKGWNELLDYLQTNNAFRKSKFINYNFDDSTLLPPLSTIQQGVLDYLNEFIALHSVGDEYHNELTKPILLPNTLYIKSPLTCIQVDQFLIQKNNKHFIDISIVSKGEDFL